ncbi:TonB family protein [Rhodopila sp.]|uniref:TonB family protein n=1 Tax=Rhodopila sp. TaxID=2480087 RepID=UPI003D0B608B
MAVLSAAPARATWQRVSVLGAAVAHGLVLAALAGGIQPPVIQAEQPTIELIMVPAAAPHEPDPRPPAEPTPAMTAAAEPVASATPRQTPAPTVVPPEPVLTPARPVLEPRPAAQQVEPAKPSIQPPVAPEVVAPAPLVPPSFPVLTAAEPTPVRRLPRPAMPRPGMPRPGMPRPGMPRPVMPRPAAAKATIPAVPDPSDATTAVASQPARPAASGEGDHHAAETLSGRIREAVQAAVRCPAAARMMGQSGKAGVAFDYRDGTVVGGVQLARSSGMSMLDAAALTAVRTAHYPEAPAEVSDQVLHLLIWVDEACGG